MKIHWEKVTQCLSKLYRSPATDFDWPVVKRHKKSEHTVDRVLVLKPILWMHEITLLSKMYFGLWIQWSKISSRWNLTTFFLMKWLQTQAWQWTLAHTVALPQQGHLLLCQSSCLGHRQSHTHRPDCPHRRWTDHCWGLLDNYPAYAKKKMKTQRAL